MTTIKKAKMMAMFSTLESLFKSKPEFQILSQQKLYHAIQDKRDCIITHAATKEYFKNRELTQIYNRTH